VKNRTRLPSQPATSPNAARLLRIYRLAMDGAEKSRGEKGVADPAHIGAAIKAITAHARLWGLGVGSGSVKVTAAAVGDGGRITITSVDLQVLAEILAKQPPVPVTPVTEATTEAKTLPPWEQPEPDTKTT
jgi:hypothetical protein